MKPKTRAISIAAAGTALGVAGLGLIAMPAGAGEAPELPPIAADELVRSVLTAEAPAFSGTVEVDNQLGLPAMPGMPSMDFDSAAVYNDGDGKGRLSVRDGGSEQTIVYNGETVWTYNSAENTASKITVPPEAAEHEAAQPAELADPAKAAEEMLSAVSESSTVSVDGTATVADRPAYELVLTPKPTERTLLREVRIAVDSETWLPLRVSVLSNNTTEPALQVGFSDLNYQAQPAELFQFSPPAGTEVTEQRPDAPAPDKKDMRGDIKTVGDGWDTVFVGTLPQELLAGAPAREGQGAQNPRALLEEFSEPVSGEFGTGRVITLNVGSALSTDDGRVAAGAVPQQVLMQALKEAK